VFEIGFFAGWGRGRFGERSVKVSRCVGD
jgi:hypothetical protein